MRTLTRAASYVRDLELAPARPCSSQGVARSPGVALREENSARGVDGRVIKERGVELGGDLRQLIGGGTRRGDVVHGKHDLDARGQHLGSSHSVLCLVHHAADRPLRGFELTLLQPQLGQAGLRVPLPLAGQPIRVLGLCELAAQPVKLGLLIVGPTDGGVDGLREPFARSLRFIHGGGPLAVQLHDLSAMHQALAAVGHEVGLRLTPAAQRRRPLMRSAQIEDSLARKKYGTVRDPRYDRRDLSGRDGNHCLIEHCHALDGLSQHDQRLALVKPAENNEVRIAEAFADRGGLAGGLVCGRRIALGQALERDRTSRYPRSTQSCSQSSSRRWARANQPPPRAASPLNMSPLPSQNAHRAPRTGSPTRRDS